MLKIYKIKREYLFRILLLLKDVKKKFIILKIIEYDSVIFFFNINDYNIVV